MKRKGSAVWLAAAVLFTALAGCSHNGGRNAGGEALPKPSEVKAYLTINVTSYNDPSNPEKGASMNNVCYDIETGEIREIKMEEDIAYTSQYPLAVYSEYDTAIYCSERIVFDDGGHGDQLAVYDLDTGEKKILTDNLFAINQIIPLEDMVVMSACPYGEGEEKPVYYEKDTGETRIFHMKDNLCVSFLSYNVYTKSLIAACFDMEQSRSRSNDYNMEQTTKLVPPDYDIYRLHLDGSEPEIIYSVEEKEINRAALDSSGRLLVTEYDENILFDYNAKTATYLIDLETGEAAEQTNIDKKLLTGYSYLCFNGEKNEVFFLGNGKYDTKTYPHGLYKYNYTTDELTMLFRVNEGYINNFCMLAK